MIGRLVTVACLSLLLALGCDRSGDSNRVVIYSSIDDPYVRPLVQRFEQKTGIKVILITDPESSKTSGLVQRIESEQANPQADVYWGNEIFHTINLAEQGIFEPYRPSIADDIPARWRDKDNLYTGIGLRARVIGFSTRPEFKDAVAKIKGLKDLADPSLKGRIGICHPAFGTASGHIAALYILWGQEKADAFMQSLRANDIKLLGGNSAVADQIAAGSLIAGPTDNDDVNNGKADGQKIDGVVPDQDGDGTLLIPTTIALVKGGPSSENGKKLIDFLLDPAVEKELIDGRYLAYSVRDAEKHVKAMDVDYVKVAHELRRSVERSLTILQGRDEKP